MSEPPANAIEGFSPAVGLMMKAQKGDRAAFAELKALGDAEGLSYTEGWGATIVLKRLQDRASDKNLLARAAVEDEIQGTIRDLSIPSDGPIERLIVGRAALCVVDARMADLEHLQAIDHYEDPRDAEPFDRRRDRAHRRLLATLKALADVRRMNRPSVQVNQLAVGDGATNVVKA